LIVVLLLFLGVCDGLFLAKDTMATIAYCMGKGTKKSLLPLGTENL
jgi:hypothetical protein